MDTAKVSYVFRYYGGLMTECERMAYQHLIATGKATHGRTDVAAQAEVRSGTSRECQYFRKLLSDDARVLLLARDGFSAFVFRTGQRILEDHADCVQLLFSMWRSGANTNSSAMSSLWARLALNVIGAKCNQSMSSMSMGA